MNSVDEIIRSDATVADKIRALAAAGYPRAEIARLLGKRYQHVRNVLEGDKLAPGMAEGDATPFEPKVHPTEWRGGGVFRMEMDAAGRLALPKEVIEAWGLKAGSVIMGHLDGEAIELIDGLTAARRVRERFQQRFPPDGTSWADELIADRRRDAAREDDDA
jgi:bifunctional DNA-binding transcriptional regulator/antitoxin component of YhaV-PrlF toxin-antitoxin module